MQNEYVCTRDGQNFIIIVAVDNATWDKLPQDVIGFPVLYCPFSDAPMFWPKPDPQVRIYRLELVNAK